MPILKCVGGFADGRQIQIEEGRQSVELSEQESARAAMAILPDGFPPAFKNIKRHVYEVRMIFGAQTQFRVLVLHGMGMDEVIHRLIDLYNPQSTIERGKR